MSKNVAVFVDVANIFYAAKAAGVDIDYVTLLRSATAGRDFVRAYAYTGLDPENENQRQFHAFLSRSGYKVVSKDIRKYGDGRIKANLDIELVVDLMRMADHIDIAVVVSGDGDFAPAIRAVQQMGVRAEVISFRGNTSSDLIEVADVFTDITQIARVEKGGRSGRRVAAEDDLSMTAVPDKETDVGPRRRRTRRGESEERRPREVSVEEPAAPAAPAVAASSSAGLVALPGERLSRAAAEASLAVVAAHEVERDAEPATDSDQDAASGQAESGRRRRRRRGGRGRGRGGRSEEGVVSIAPDLVDELEVEDLLEEEVLPLPQHSTFGSVWDTQIGVPTSARSAASLEDQEPFEDEPEVPEYLLAERQQRGGRRGSRGRGTRSGGYQSAVDRERYGRSTGHPGSGPRTMTRGGGQRPQGQPARAPRPTQPLPGTSGRGMSETASAEPWSEVPPEVQELLRAELARRQVAAAQPGRPPEVEATEPGPKAEKPARRGGRGRSAADAQADAEAAPRSTSRRRASTRQAGPESGSPTGIDVEVKASTEDAAGPAESAEPVKPAARARASATSRRRAVSGEAEAAEKPAPRRRVSSTRAAPSKEAGSTPEAGTEASAEQPEGATKPRRRSSARSKAGSDSSET